jgi:GntR family transcriptional repressor for pyruvate dehydrogenase complex
MTFQVSAIQRTRRDTPSAEILRQLIDHFLQSGDVKSGHKLPSERVLAEQFQIGRTAVRDALHSMEMLNLIEVRPGDGTYVKNSGPAVIPELFRWALALRQPDLSELLETRLEVEVTVARRAASRHTQAELVSLRSALNRMCSAQEAKAIAAFVDADIEFHLVISRMAQIPVLADFLTGVRALLEGWMQRTLEADSTRAAAACQEHEAVLLAIQAADPDGSATAMRTHVMNAREKLTRLDSLEANAR